MLVETALMELMIYHRSLLKYITPWHLQTQLDKHNSRNNHDVLANCVSAELHALADDEVGFRGRNCHCSAAGVLLPTLASLHTWGWITDANSRAR